MRHISQDVEAEEYLVTLFVQGDDAAPRYRDGDRLICAPKASPELGEDIVVIIRDGNIRVGRLASLEGGAIVIDQGTAERTSIPRGEVGAIWPVRLMAPGRFTSYVSTPLN
ncbi:MAG: S24 family peptidase [Alphaproteobacteria bacterium]|nr:S24 family peptidase [Alphaproteobacteria bacterium]